MTDKHFEVVIVSVGRCMGRPSAGKLKVLRAVVAPSSQPTAHITITVTEVAGEAPLGSNCLAYILSLQDDLTADMSNAYRAPGNPTSTFQQSKVQTKLSEKARRRSYANTPTV